MEVFEAISGRRSIRKFKEVPVGKEVIEQILEAGLAAPSAGNLQARRIHVVISRSVKAALADAALGQGFVAEAPVVLVVCADLERIAPYGERGKSLYCLQDAAAAVQNMLLAAYDKGLGTCWVGAFNEAAVARILSLPERLRPVAIVPMGVPAEQPRRSPRYSMGSEVKWV
ncbi:MAG: nitroreductase family protein [Candidatus Thermoplasmatota archaeon]